MTDAPDRIWLNCTPDGIDPEWFGKPDQRPKDKQPPWPEVEYISLAAATTRTTLAEIAEGGG